MAGAKCLGGLDLDRQVVCAHLVAVMRAMDQEPAGTHRFQALERSGNPVDVGQGLGFDRDLCAGARHHGAHARPRVVQSGLVDVELDTVQAGCLVDLGDGDHMAVELEFDAETVIKPSGVGFRG